MIETDGDNARDDDDDESNVYADRYERRWQMF